MFAGILSGVLLVLMSSAEPRAVERHVLEKINAERAEVRLNTLRWDEDLSAIARAHSEDMLKRGYFAHVNPDGLDPTGRAAAAGYSCKVTRGEFSRTGLGENIYGTQLYKPVLYRPGPMFFHELRTSEELAIAAVKAWMESEGHRENILRSGIRRTGIGVAFGKDDRVLITQMFC
jgi:uncharacterized protein YkwD